MALLTPPTRKFKPAKVLEATWDSFRKGLNTLLRDSELDPEQSKQMQNLILEGKGIVTQRPGTANLYQASTNGKLRGLFGAKIAGVNELLAISDDGYLTKKNGDTNTVITGASWASGYKVRMAQLQDQVYIVQPTKSMTRYDGTTLLSYTTLLSPVSLTATNISGVTGTFTYSWRVSAFTDIGRTLASDPVVLANLPENLSDSSVQITWSAPTGASGLIKGYDIFGRERGDETRMVGVSPSSTTWIDDGSSEPTLLTGTPEYNETAGPNAKFIIKSVGKIIVANIGSQTSRLAWSGAGINAGRFSWTVGGGYIDLDDNDGTVITGMVEVEENKVVVWKERSIFQVKLTFNASVGAVEPIITKITGEVGCVSADTIQPANNNHFFIGLRPGRGISLNSLGYERNIAAAILRTAEISKVISPDLEGVNLARLTDMFAVVYAGLYWWFFPVGTTNMTCYGYDIERLSINGPHTFPDGPVVGAVWYDTLGMPRMIYGDGDDGYITEVSRSYTNDKGVDFQWSFTSKKENFGLPFKLKTLLKAFVHIADVQGGLVNVQLLTENDEGNVSTTESFNVEAPNKYAGFGTFPFGYKITFGSEDQSSTSATNTSDVRKYLDLNTPNAVAAQYLITGTGVRAKIIETQLSAREQVSPPADWRVSS